ncbi:MAG: diguanylate cyclase [Chloroflexi bacterium]|nr:diguanylate cyclase [Chloroflexota bacterium]
MEMNFTPGLWLFILAAVVMTGLMGATWQFRKTSTGRAFLLLFLCALVWVVGFSFETAAGSLQAKILFANLQFAGLSFIPSAWLYLAFSCRGKTRPARDWILLALLPLLTNLIIWTDSFHHWFRGAPGIDAASAPFPVLVNDYQFWFYFIHAPSGYIYILAAILVMTRGLRKMQPIYRNQTLLLLAALALPVLTDLLYVFGYSPIRYYNITPAAFSISAAIVAWDLFRFRFLDLRPMARDMVVESLQEGIIVLDHKNRIVDFNRAAQKIAELTGAAIGKNPREVELQFLQAINDLAAQGKSWTEIHIGENPTLYYELRSSEIRDPGNQPLGRIITIRDNTEHAERFHKVEYAATHDDLTNLLGRQQFSELVNHELQRGPGPAHHPCSILMFDLDGFKSINDRCGHAAGDEALILTARKCEKVLRPADIVGRIGGDEFAVFLAGADTRSAFVAAERLRKGIEKIKFKVGGETIALTISIGIHTATNPNDNFSDIIKQADKAMYRAKGLGGNSIVDSATPANHMPDKGKEPHGKEP